MKMNKTAMAVALAFPLLANAQSSAQLQSQIEALKAQVQQLEALVKQKVASDEAPVELEEFNRIKTKVEAAEDIAEASGFKGLRVTGGLDPAYVWNSAKGISTFSFGNPLANSNNANNELYTYDNSYFGAAYIDFQKEMEGGSKMRLTLMPEKSVGSGITSGSIIQEASASIPLSDAQTRLMVGQMGDVSGYEPTLNTYTGANNVSSNQLYPGYAEYFITKNMLFDFTAANFYTGAGIDMIRGPWEYKFWLANFNSNRTNVASSNAAADTRASEPAFIYNATYAQEEFWGFEFTGYEAHVGTPQGPLGRLDQFEIDGNYTRGDFNGNLQFTVGRLENGAFDGSGDSRWWGFSALASEKVGANWVLAGRLDYLNNQANGGGLFTITNNVGGTSASYGDVINGFGAGDPNAAGYDATVGANRTSLSGAATYRLNRNVAFRGELRRDFSTKPTFYNYGNGSFQSANTTIGLQTIVNF